MDEQKLLQLLKDKKLLDQDALDQIAKEAGSLKKGIEEIIYERNVVSEVEVVKAKSSILGIPYREVKAKDVSPDVLKLVPEETARTYQVIPIEKTGDMLVAGMVHPDDPNAQNALRFIAKQLGVNLGVYIVTPGDIDLLLRKYTPFADEIQAALQSLQLKKGQFQSPMQRIIKLEEGGTVTGEAPVIRIVSAMVREAVDGGASDIHIEPEKTYLKIRFRIDGELHEMSKLPVELHQPIVSRVKVLSNLRIDETRVPQDGRFRTVVFGREIDFRIATFPTPNGEKVSMRVLDPTVGLKGLDDLGISEGNIALMKSAITKPYGMILLTGPTGSGKTTTLYALMQILNTEGVNIVSLEDPVEYTIEGLNQSQVRPEIGYTFASGLRQILRQDPDVIMVGEIRDGETASLAVHAALTGHIVLSTLHTNNAIGVIPRLIDMGVDAFLLPYALSLMAGQRLVPRLCDACKKEKDLSPALRERLEKEIAEMPDQAKKQIKKPYKSYYSEGCDVCNGKGTSGRIAVYEALSMSQELSNIVGSGVSDQKIIDEARRQGMITMKQDGIIKALSGVTSLEDMLKEGEGLSLM